MTRTYYRFLLLLVLLMATACWLAVRAEIPQARSDSDHQPVAVTDSGSTVPGELSDCTSFSDCYPMPELPDASDPPVIAGERVMLFELLGTWPGHVVEIIMTEDLSWRFANGTLRYMVRGAPDSVQMFAARIDTRSTGQLEIDLVPSPSNGSLAIQPPDGEGAGDKEY